MSTRSRDRYLVASVDDSDGLEGSEPVDQQEQQSKHWSASRDFVSLHRAIPLQALQPSIASDWTSRPVSSKPSSSSRAAIKWLVRDWWPWEVFCWILSLACFGAVIAVLTIFNNRPLPDWPFGITPNALVSVFATVQSTLLAIPVSTGMGQLKWTCFRQPQKLDMFEAIEGAGRDPIAAATLLLRRQGGQVSSSANSALTYDG